MSKSQVERPERMNMIYYPTVYDRSTELLLGQLVDINTHGIKLLSMKPIEVGKHFELRIELSPTVDGNKQIIVEGETVWSDNDINPDFYATGIKFTKLDMYNRDVIGKFIEKYRFQSTFHT